MTAAPATTPAPATTSVSPTAHQLWSRWRAVLAAGLALAVFGVLYAALQSGENHHALDPRSPDPAGSRALAQLLGDRGVTTTVVTTTDEATAAVGPDTTLLITVPDLLTTHQQSLLRKAMARSGDGRTVLLDPSDSSVAVLAPGVHYAGPTAVQTRRAGCDLPAAVRAGDADLGGTAYTTTAEGADRCYRTVAGNPTLVRLSTAGGDIVVLGTHTLLQNENLTDQGNASLALQILGAHSQLVWYLPSLDDAAAFDGGRQNFLDLIPDGWSWALLQLLIAAVLAALWRARRLGPVVTERLPATVRAAEATEGRARLYRRGNARARAAEALRTATRDRLAPLLGIPPSQAHDPGVVALAIAARLDDPATDPRVLLHGPPPADDAALLHLADDLDALERRILRNERKATP